MLLYLKLFSVYDYSEWISEMYFCENKNYYIFIKAFIFTFILNLMILFLFSKIKWKNTKLNPFFWLWYSRIIPIFSVFSIPYYAISNDKISKKDIIIFTLWELFFSVVLVINTYLWCNNYWNILNFLVWFFPVILFFKLWILDIIYTKIILKNKNSLI